MRRWVCRFASTLGVAFSATLVGDALAQDRDFDEPRAERRGGSVFEEDSRFDNRGAPPARAPFDRDAAPRARNDFDRPFSEQRSGSFNDDRRQREFGDEVRREESGRRSFRKDSSDDRQQSERQGEASLEELGLSLDSRDGSGLMVSHVEHDSAAAEARIREGDRILSVNNRTINDQRQFEQMLSMAEGDVPVIIERNGQRYTVQLPGSASSQAGQEDDSAWLGVGLAESGRGEGVQVSHVYPAGPASRAGFRTGDVIIEMNGREVTDAQRLADQIEQLSPRETTDFVVLRNGRELDLSARLASRNAFMWNQSFGDEQYTSSEGAMRSDGGSEASYDFPPWAMSLEHDRRVAEQHQRIEQQLIELRQEVRELRELLEERR